MTTPLPPGTRVRIEDSYGYAYPDPIARGTYLMVTIADLGNVIVSAGVRRDRMVEVPLTAETITDAEIRHANRAGRIHAMATETALDETVDPAGRYDARARIVAHLLAQPALAGVV